MKEEDGIVEKPVIRAEAFKNRDQPSTIYANLLQKDEDSLEQYKMLVDIDEVTQLVQHFEDKVDSDSNMSLPDGSNSSEEEYAKSYLRKIRRRLEKARKEEIELSDEKGDGSE